MPVGVADGLGAVTSGDLGQQVVDMAFTVVSETKSRAAISALDSPAAIRASASASRGDGLARICFVKIGYVWSLDTVRRLSSGLS